MYIDIGGAALTDGEIIGIFDLDGASTAKQTRDYLRQAQRAKEVVPLTGDLPKSFVLSGDQTAQTVYISQLAAATVVQRTRQDKKQQ